MHELKVKDLMISITEYATVSQNDDLLSAILALEATLEKFERHEHPYRALLVLDKNNNVVGKLSMLDVLRALDPKYKDFGEVHIISRFGFGPAIHDAMIENLSLFKLPLENLCKKSASTLVKNVMYTPKEGEYVDVEMGLNEVVHRLVVGHHQSLLVTRDDEIVGIIRLSDVFHEICNMIKSGQC